MKKQLLQLLFIAYISIAYSQSPNIHISGNRILGVCNDTIVLHGIDYAPFDWGWDITDEKFSEIAKTGANCVRIVWYSSATAGGGAPVYNNISNIDTAIARCIRNKMIAIIELHDNTCDSSMSQLVALSNWYLGAAVKSVINKYAHSLIINIANEAGYVEWASNPTTALAEFKSTYERIVTNIRNAGINVPLLIDAPDCGTNLTALASIATAMEAADAGHNLIFSTHAYWYAYANNDSLTMRNIITGALVQNVPIVLGELSNLQDGTTNCQYALNYKPLLKICKQLNVGWISWSWDEDVCSARQISADGNYANLTTYGNDIVNNPEYGLKQHAILTDYLANKQTCSIGTGINESGIRSYELGINIYPNPNDGNFILEIKGNSGESYVLKIKNLPGEELFTEKFITLGNKHIQNINLSKLSNGIYQMSIFNENNEFKKVIMIQK